MVSYYGSFPHLMESFRGQLSQQGINVHDFLCIILLRRVVDTIIVLTPVALICPTKIPAHPLDLLTWAER